MSIHYGTSASFYYYKFDEEEWCHRRKVAAHRYAFRLDLADLQNELDEVVGDKLENWPVDQRIVVNKLDPGIDAVNSLSWWLYTQGGDPKSIVWYCNMKFRLGGEQAIKISEFFEDAHGDGFASGYTPHKRMNSELLAGRDECEQISKSFKRLRSC